MNDDIQSSLKFVSALSEFSKQVGHKEMALYDIEFNSLCFGSFSIIFGKRKSRFKATWDGKEFFLDLFQSNFSDSRSSNDWNHLENKRINPASYQIIFQEILNEI